MSRPCSLNVRLHSAWWRQVNHALWGIEKIRDAKSVGVNAFWQTTMGNKKESIGARDDPTCVQNGSLWAALMRQAEVAVHSPTQQADHVSMEEQDGTSSPCTPPRGVDRHRRWRRRILGKQALITMCHTCSHMGSHLRSPTTFVT